MLDDILDYLFGAASFAPHGVCLLWRPDLVAMHAIGDALTALAYLIIPAAILYFVRRRPDLGPEQLRVGALFSAFILACALTHIAGFVTLWEPLYGLQGLIKMGTAAISLATAWAIWALMPQLLAIPSPVLLAEANGRLTAEIAAKEAALAELRAAREGLEREVAARTAELRRQTARFELALAGSGVTMFEQDERLTYTWIHNPAGGMRADDVIGRTDAEILPPEARPIADIKTRVLATGGGAHEEVNIPFGTGERWYDLFVEPTTLADGRPGVLSLAIDVTERKRHADQLKTITSEALHRVKNLFAVVQSLMAQTAQRAATIQDFKRDFSGRVTSLARAYDQLAEENWRAAPLKAVIESVIEPLAGPAATRVTAIGPDVRLSGNEVQYLSLALHELATNALKYGALSQDGGGVTIRWTATSDADGSAQLDLAWTETGGPPAVASARAGFGRMMIEKLVPSALRGEATLAFAATGLTWRLRAPLTEGAKGAVAA